MDGVVRKACRKSSRLSPAGEAIRWPFIKELNVERIQFRVPFCNQRHFLFPSPILDLFLSGNRLTDVRVLFIIKQPVNVVPAAEGFWLASVLVMFNYPLAQVVGDTSIKNFLQAVGEDIDMKRLLIHV